MSHSRSNRRVKLNLYKRDPHCHWCGVLTTLTNIKHIHGQPDPTMATVDHIISRFDPRRWVEQKPGEIRKVLACFSCNNRRSIEDQKKLRKEEELLRSTTGFCLYRANGKTIFDKPLANLEMVLDRLREYGKLTV